MGLLLLQATGEHPVTATDLSSWAAAGGIVVAILTLASFLGGYFALRKQVDKIDDRLREVTKALPDLARRKELEELSSHVQGLRIANEGLRTANESFVQNIQLAVQQFTGVLTIISKIQAEVSDVRKDLDDVKSKMQGA